MKRWTLGDPGPPVLSADRPAVLAVDPGKVTGLAYLPAPGPRSPTAFPEAPFLAEQGTHEALLTAGSAISAYAAHAGAAPLQVVCESFHITARTARNTFAPWSLESIGVLRFLTACTRDQPSPVSFTLQTPSNAKRAATNQRLTEVGWYAPSEGGHAADAARHLYLYLFRSRLLAPRRTP